MIKNIGIGSAIGKIILIGEHSVVYGEPAIAIPFPSARIQTIIFKSNRDTILDCFSYKGSLIDAPENLLGLSSVVKEIVNSFNKSLVGFDIKIDSSIPSERGMGSSAAVAASTIRALYNYFERDLDKNTLRRLVDFSEKIVHGNPSGIDTAIVVEEKSLYYIKGEPIKEFDSNLDGYLIVADTGEKGMTKFAVSKVRKFIEENSNKGTEIIDLLGKFTVEARISIIENKALELGNIMNKAQSLLSEIGVSNTTIENLVRVSLENGGFGSKLTGGGLGGCIITLCANKEDAINISEALLNNGANNTWIMNMNSRGDDYNEG